MKQSVIRLNPTAISQNKNMAGYIQNGSLPIPPISDTQASILDMLLFPGFTRMSTAVQWYLTIDLNVYVPPLCFLGLLAFGCRRIFKYLWGFLETYCTSTVHLRFRDEAYDIVITWISSQSFIKNARSLLATTELASSNRSRNDPPNGGDANKKTLYYTPWNGRFFMWYKGHLLVFRRQYQAGEFSSREEVSISSFGRSPQILMELLSECNTEYTKLVQDKTCVYEHQDGTWVRSEVADRRRIETVVLNESGKRELLKHIGDFLNPTSQRWYSNRGIPYRMGYLLYGPPGTGKSSLSKSIAGHFGLDIYILSLSATNEATLKSLFARLPSRCIILLEDIDAVSSNRSGDADGEDSQWNKSVGGKISLSTLLNVIDGVASKEGRVLVMTTNHISNLDEALIRPGRVDKKVELGLADRKMTSDLFCLVFKPVIGDVAPPEATHSEVLVGEDGKPPEAARSQREDVERVEQLAKEFAAKVPELKFSPAGILSFLLEYKQSPEEAIDDVEQLISKLIEAKSESPVVFEDIKSEDALPETGRASKPESKTEAYHPSALTTAPTEMVYCGPTSSLPASPPDSLSSLPIIAWSDDQTTEMANAIAAMNMAPTLSSHFSYSETLFGNPPPTPYPCPSCTKSSSQVATDFAQQVVEALKLVNAKQEVPPLVQPSRADHEDKSEELRARASTLEFKMVNEVWDKKEYKYKIVESLTPPDQLNELDHYIFVVRTRIDKETKKQIQYIDIKSPGLRDIVRKILQDVQGICLYEEKPSVEQSLLYHYLSDLEECLQSPSAALDPSALEHLHLLLAFIRKAYASTIEYLGPLLENRQITYDLLWTLFKPNTLAYTKCFGTGQPRCVRYDFGEEKKTKDGLEYFYVKARYLDFDGKIFGETLSEHAIEKFRGVKQITALEVFPLKHHPGEKQERAKLSEYGRKFLSMMDIHLCEYEGKAFYIEKGRVVEIFIKSRIVVDAAYFREENPNYARPSIKESNGGSPAGWILIDLDGIDEEEPSLAKSNGLDPSEVKGDDLLICSPTVPGFSLSNSRWVEFSVADIKDIDWKQAALDDLHIPAKKKKAAQALSEAHVKRASTNAFDDVVKGKGQGFNVLLHGPPGVGKTLTAELLAEHLQKPLMQVSAGELGTTAEAVEQRLPRLFKRAARWNAVLLLDEADVFLEQRSAQDIHRNALVCVFLRTLEYYQGMMFLTTNRVGQIDDAIASRIHFKLMYGKLNLEQRTNIWRRFLEKAVTPQGEPTYSRDAFASLAGKERNGREIKNLVSTAHALATQEGCQVTMSHLEIAINACEDFEYDFRGVGQVENLNAYN